MTSKPEVNVNCCHPAITFIVSDMAIHRFINSCNVRFGDFAVMAKCPFRAGDEVVYDPSPRGRALNLHTSLEALVPGKTYRVARVQNEVYVVPEGFEHSETGGLYWTEFRAKYS